MSTPIGISVIICTYNRTWLVKKCLDSLAAQTLKTPTCEVIVVDGSPNNETRLLVAEYSEKLPFVRYVFEEKPGHSNARNRGYYESSGDYLIYLDDDAMVPPDYLENVVRDLSNYSPDIMGGPVYPYYTSPQPWWFRDEFEIRKYEEQSGFSTTCGISGGNFIIRKSLLGSLGLFDPRYGMSKGRLGMLDDRKVLETYRASTPLEQQKVYYSLDCYVYHYAPAEKMHMGYILKRAFSSGSAQFWMRLDIDGRPNKVKGFQLLQYGISSLLFLDIAKRVMKYIHEVLKNTKFIPPVVNGLILVAKGIGYNMALLRYYFERLFVRNKI